MKQYTFFLLFVCAFAANAQTKVNFETLLNELVDREQLTYHPDGLWTQHQVSSYERVSKDQNTPEWYANHDWSEFYGEETYNGKKMKVVMDVDGPGVITRMWTAGDPQQKRTLVVLVDGKKKPLWEVERASEFIGQNEDFGQPLSFRSVERDSLTINRHGKPGYNLYAPIPFEKNIKILYDAFEVKPEKAKKGFFYNFNYRLYHGKVNLKSYSDKTLKKYETVKSEVDAEITNFHKVSIAKTKIAKELNNTNKMFTLAKGEKVVLDVNTNNAISSTLLKVKAKFLKQAVQKLNIRFDFDGEKTVEMPIGFFYGCGDQMVKAKDRYRKVEKNGTMASYWVMPFKKKARVTLINKGNQVIEGKLNVGTQDYKWTKQSMYFHGGYHVKEDWEITKRQGEDFLFEEVKGEGVYVADTYQIFKPFGIWWGEGDEKIYIDQDKFPDHFGTGTEDYYGYAWGHPETFNLPYITQPIGKGNISKKTPGTTVNSRIRGLDGIPFQKFLKFDMEMWGWVSRTVDVKWATFWYQK